MSLSWRAVCLLAVLFSVLGSVLFMGTILVKALTGGDKVNQYAIISDAGSSHTEVILYRWKVEKLNAPVIVHQVQGAKCDVKGGISSSKDNLDQTVEKLLSCYKKVSEHIELQEGVVTPIYLLATAGMRLLQKSNSALSQLIFTKIENALLKYKVKGKQFDIREVGLLTGGQEAASAWIAANVASKTFENAKSSQSVGILEQGGASAQIAYEVKNDVPEKLEVLNSTLYGKTYRIRGSSDLCYGADALLTRHRVLLARGIAQTGSRVGTVVVPDPCTNHGIEIEVTGQKLKTVCTEHVLGNIGDNTKYKFQGSYNLQGCTDHVQVLTSKACSNDFDICFKEEPVKPPANMTFYAIANYFYSTQFLRETGQNSFTEDEFKTLTYRFCDKTKQDIEDLSGYNLDFASRFCFFLNYFAHSLKNIYKFESEDWTRIKFVKKINDKSLAWTLGFAVNATNFISAPPPEPSIINTWQLVVLLISSVAFIFAGIVLFGFYRSRNFKKYTQDEEHQMS